MKKLSIVMMVIMMVAQLSGHAQYIKKPFTITTVSYIHPFQLPISPLIKQQPIVKRTQGINPSTSAICPATCSIALPVTLLELSGSRLNNTQVALNWKTQNEINSKGFDIERSQDGGMTFAVVGNMASDTSKTVEKKYAETDMNNYAQISYYRIKQIDIDSRFTYSNTISVKGYNVDQKAALTPNPATTFTVINCFSAANGKGIVSILSANGQKINETPWGLFAGSNTLKLALSSYAAGLYYVQLAWPDGNKSVMKLVVK